MRHQKARRRLKRSFSHRTAMLENLVTSLFRHQQVQTTWAKAKEAQRMADRLITLGKLNTLHARRRAFQVLQDREMTGELFEKIAPRFKARSGGYTRVLHLGSRKGDAAPLAVLELTDKEIREKKIKAKAEKHPKHEHDHPEGKHEHPHAAPEKARHDKQESAPKPTREKPGFLKNIQQFFRRKSGGA